MLKLRKYEELFLNKYEDRNSRKYMLRMNSNKGFSLVELIIVIAIMAILSAALAPQLMKYIEKSRVSTDMQTCSALEDTLYAALTNDKVWQNMSEGRNGTQFRFYVRMSEDGKILIDGLLDNYNSSNEIRSLINKLENPKQTGRNSYEVIIKSAKNTITDPITGKKETTYTINGVTVGTHTKKFTANCETNYNW